MKKTQLIHEQITKLADDIRVIQDFTASHNFDLSLLNASVSPSSKKAMSDKALICIILFIALLLIDIAAVVFSESISENQTSTY